MPSSAIDKVKVWIFPTLVSVLGMLLYQEIKEIKSDVKALLAQSNIDKTRIDNLERFLYKESSTHVLKAVPPEQDPPAPIKFLLTEFVLPGKNELDDEEV